MLRQFGNSNITRKIYFITQAKKACKNFSNVSFNVIRNNFPISVTFKDDVQMKVENIHDLIFLCVDNAWKHCQINGDELQVKFNDHIVKFSNWRHNGDITSIFINEDYKKIPVKGAIVVDVGANIGDSSIYFSLCGAKSVIAIEPSSANYKSMKKNVNLNKLMNIEFKNVGLADKNQKVKLDRNSLSNGPMIKSDTGIEIELITLEDIVKEKQIELGVLKLDCEGCEHEIILSAKSNVLSKFKYIYVELHYDTINSINEIKEKLVKDGFDVSFIYLNNNTIPQFLEAKQC